MKVSLERHRSLKRRRSDLDPDHLLLASPLARIYLESSLRQRSDLPPNIAFRFGAENQATATEDYQRIYGRCVTYNALSEPLGSYRECFAPGCFRASLADPKFDGRVLFEHSPAWVLGRCSASTARFYENDMGVSYEAEVPAASWALDLCVTLERGDISQSGVGCIVQEHRWEMRDNQRVRVITRALLVEASVVSFPIHRQTSAQLSAARTSLLGLRLQHLKSLGGLH